MRTEVNQSLLCALEFTEHKTPRGGAVHAHIETMAKDNSVGLVSSLVREGQEVPPSSHLHLAHVPMSKHSMAQGIESTLSSFPFLPVGQVLK